MFFSKSMAGGRHVGPPGETPKSPQSPEHVFGPEENKGTIVDTTRNDAKLLFPSNFKHLLTHYPRFWAKLRQLESMSRVGTDSLRAFGCSNSHRPRRLWRPRAKQLQCRAASTKLNLQTEAPTAATVFGKSRFLDIFCGSSLQTANRPFCFCWWPNMPTVALWKPWSHHKLSGVGFTDCIARFVCPVVLERHGSWIGTLRSNSCFEERQMLSLVKRTKRAILV